MLAGGVRPALHSNDENAVEWTKMRSSSSKNVSSASSSLSSLSKGGGGVVTDENSLHSSKMKSKSVRMALGPSLSSSSNGGGGNKTPGQSTSTRRKALGDISNRKLGAEGGAGGGGAVKRASKSSVGGDGGGGGGGGSFVLKPSYKYSKNVLFQRTPGRSTVGGGVKGEGGGGSSGENVPKSTKKIPNTSAKKRSGDGGGGNIPLLSQLRNDVASTAPASVKKADFTLPRRQVSFGADAIKSAPSSSSLPFSTRVEPPPPTHRRPKSDVWDKAPEAAPLGPDAGRVQDVELPAGGRVWDPNDFFDDDLSKCSAEYLRFPPEEFRIVEQTQREGRLKELDRIISEREAEWDKKVERQIRKDYNDAKERMENFVFVLDFEEDLTNDPILLGLGGIQTPFCPLNDDISI